MSFASSANKAFLPPGKKWSLVAQVTFLCLLYHHLSQSGRCSILCTYAATAPLRSTPEWHAVKGSL